MNEVSGRHALAERPERTRSLRRLPQHSVSNVLIPFSQAIDLAEGREPGHAQRVAFIAMSIAETLGLDKESQLAACYAGLLHDLGVVAAGADIAGSTSGDERLVFASLPLLTPDEALAGAGDHTYSYVDRVAGHVDHGARAATVPRPLGRGRARDRYASRDLGRRRLSRRAPGPGDAGYRAHRGSGGPCRSA